MNKLFINKYPLFEKQRILKVEMLELLRDFPIDIVKIFTKDYSDGILRGCEIRVEESKIILEPGIIVFKGNIYFIKKRQYITYSNNEKLTALKIKFYRKEKEGDFLEFKGDIFLDEDITLKENELELCRFKLNHRARLRIDHEHFEDLSTYYNTINIINTLYSAPRKSTISPYICSFFAKEMFQYKLEDPLDIGFCMLCLNEELIKRSLITQYIRSKLSLQKEKFSNEDIYKYLLDILSTIKGSKSKTSGKSSLGKKIIID